MSKEKQSVPMCRAFRNIKIGPDERDQERVKSVIEKLEVDFFSLFELGLRALVREQSWRCQPGNGREFHSLDEVVEGHGFEAAKADEGVDLFEEDRLVVVLGMSLF